MNTAEQILTNETGEAKHRTRGYHNNEEITNSETRTKIYKFETNTEETQRKEWKDTLGIPKGE